MALMHDVAREAQPEAPIAVLSGPTFAHEVAAGLPAAVTLAVEDRALGERLRAPDRPALVPPLSVRRRRRRRDRRRGQERARHRLRRGRGPPARPQRPLRPDLARLRRDDPLRPRPRRPRRDPRRPVGPRRPRPHLLLDQLAQLQPRQGPGRGPRAPPSCSPTAARWRKAPIPRRCWRGRRGRRASTCRSSRRCARLLAGEASVDEVVERLLSRPLRSEGTVTVIPAKAGTSATTKARRVSPRSRPPPG